MNKVALIIGHSKERGGASNEKHGINEFEFNRRLSALVAKALIENDIYPVIIERDCKYSQLPEKVNAHYADAIVSLHCNAFNKSASGSEVLHCYKSEKGNALAYQINHYVNMSLLNHNRGSKAVSKGERGFTILSQTTAPCVIVEPFFIDNNAELENAQNKINSLALAIAFGIKQYFDLSDQ